VVPFPAHLGTRCVKDGFALAPPLLWLRGEMDKIFQKIEPVMEYPLVI
jgi:hypothetical protein